MSLLKAENQKKRTGSQSTVVYANAAGYISVDQPVTCTSAHIIYICIKIYLKQQYSITAGTVFTVASTSTSIYWSVGQWQNCTTKRDREKETETQTDDTGNADKVNVYIWQHVIKKQNSACTHVLENDRSIQPVTTEVSRTIITHAMQKHCSHLLTVTLSPGQWAKKASTLCEW